MYKKAYYSKTTMDRVEALLEGEPIETKVQRLIQNKEPIKDGAPLIYTERKDGVNAAYNIRTDRWEVATEAMNKIVKSKEAQRDALMKGEAEEKDGKIIPIKKKDVGKPESTHGKAESK